MSAVGYAPVFGLDVKIPPFTNPPVMTGANTKPSFASQLTLKLPVPAVALSSKVSISFSSANEPLPVNDDIACHIIIFVVEVTPASVTVNVPLLNGVRPKSTSIVVTAKPLGEIVVAVLIADNVSS